MIDSQRVLYEQARAALMQERYDAAEYCCRQILDQRSKDPAALTLLAQVMVRIGREDEARESLQTAVRAHPKNPALRADLGHFYSDIGEFRQAVLQFDKALKLSPGLLPAIAGKAEAYERQGKYDRAHRTLEPHIKGEETPPSLAVTQMRILNHARDYKAAVRLGQQVLNRGHSDSIMVRNLWFELARAFEKGGDYERAFDAAKQGNAVLAPVYDPEEDRRFIDSLIDYFSRERVNNLPTASDATQLPVFIVGIQRSGSTLVERVIASHPQAQGVGELSYLHVLTADMPLLLDSGESFPQCMDELTTELADEQGRQYLNVLNTMTGPVDRVVNKDLANFLRLGLINSLFPGAQVIHCQRDPMDTCLSCYMERLLPHQAPFSTDLRYLGMFYTQYERLMKHWRNVLNLKMIDVRYEDLVADQERVSREIIDFCGLPWDDRCLSFHEGRDVAKTLSYAQVRQPVYNSSIGRAERFDSLLDPLRETLQPSKLAN